MQIIVRYLILGVVSVGLASCAVLLHVTTALAAGVVTNCTTYGPGPGTLEAAIETDGLVTFACSGTIVLPSEIAMGNNRRLVIDGSGQSITLSGGNRTRLFNLFRGASLSLHHVTLASGNAGSGGGGAIMNGGLLTITHSTLISNTASYGGALELFNGKTYIYNSTLVGNQALGVEQDTGGGAINQYFVGQDQGDKPYETPYVEIVNSTIAGNRAGLADRAGIWQENGRLLIYYSILADNEGSNCLIRPPNVQGQFASFGSMDDDGSCLSAQQLDPQLGPLGRYGGGTWSFALLPGSPAIDAAPAGACAGMIDQRNTLRPRDGNHDGEPACDLGSYEYADRYLVAAASAEGLEGYWKFDEGGGEAVMDSSGHGLAGAVFGGGAFTPDHPPLLFNAPYALQSRVAGAPAGVQVADAGALNPPSQLTVAAWVHLDRSDGVQPIAVKMDDGQGRGYGLYLRGGELSAEVVDGAGVRHVITGEVTAGGWLHVAMTYRQGGEMAAYVNGRRTGVQATPEALSSAAVPLLMAVDGALDDVRVYSRELSPGAVAALASGRHCVTTGATWADAMPDLQCALLEATADAEVWVAPGVYRPTYGPDRTASFAIPDGVGVYGGFTGSESQRDQRLPQTPLPVLSGDIQANDPVDAAGLLADPSAVVGGNAFHVVSISSTLTSTVLERVTISGGQADAAPGPTCGFACGGGIYLQGGAPQISGVRLVGNSATGWGGAIYGEQSSALVMSTTAHANRASSGGAVLWQGAAPVLANSLIAGNLATTGDGGGVYSLNSSLRLVNVTVAANRASVRGGGLMFNGGAVTAANLVVGANAAAGDPEVGGDGAAIEASLVQGGCPTSIACSAVQAGDPLFAAVDSAGAPSAGGDYHLLPASPAIDGGDNNASLAPGAPQGATVASLAADLGGGPRLVPVLALPPRIDQGAYEAANAPPVFLTEPVTSGFTTVRYIYQAVAVDPNFPNTRLPVEGVTLAQWLRLELQLDGSALLHGTPEPLWYGAYPIVLRSIDNLGAVTDQTFTLYIQQRIYSMYLPFLSRRVK